MIKVVTASEMVRIEKAAFSEGVSERALMERAGEEIARFIEAYAARTGTHKKITVLAGKGNNAGDAYCTVLLLPGYSVKVYQLYPLKDCSPLCQRYAEEFRKKGGEITEVFEEKEIVYPDDGILLDAVFGSGFHGSLSLFIQEIFLSTKRLKIPIFSIDIPSGLSGDDGVVADHAVHADHTLALGLPKTGFFLRDGWDCVGRLHLLDIGLEKKYIDRAGESHLLITDEVRSFLPRMKRSAHKYEAGFVIGIAGSEGMFGASVLSGSAVLKTGSGIVKLVHLDKPFSGYSPPELIHKTFAAEDLSGIRDYGKKAGAFFIGPGMGVTEKNKVFLRDFLPTLEQPCVLDADALTLIAEERIPFPKETIVTPQRAEAARLLGSVAPDDERFADKCADYARKHRIIFILKGGPTFIFYPDGKKYICAEGDPGMATAGSGDVLTGIIASLLARGVSWKEAGLLGVYIHGFAGKKAAELYGSTAMTASDILANIYRFF